MRFRFIQSSFRDGLLRSLIWVLRIWRNVYCIISSFLNTGLLARFSSLLFSLSLVTQHFISQSPSTSSHWLEKNRLPQIDPDLPQPSRACQGPEAVPKTLQGVHFPFCKGKDLFSHNCTLTLSWRYVYLGQLSTGRYGYNWKPIPRIITFTLSVSGR